MAQPWEEAKGLKPWEEAAKLKNQPAADDTWTGSALSAAKDFGRGLAKGVGKFADELPTLGTPHVSELDPRVKQFEESPNATASESIGEFGGENIPFMIGGPEAAIGKQVARALPFAGKMARPVGEFLGHSLWGGAAGAAQPVKEGESRLANAAGGAATAGLLSPKVAGLGVGMAGGTAAGLGFEQLVRHFGWEPVLGALGALGVGAGHFGLGGLARRAATVARKPGEAIGRKIPAGLAGAAGGEATEGAQENLDQQ
jgi:hypothetical protein